MRGRLITVDGIEGAGKSTQLEQIDAYLQNAGKRVLCSREPGGTPLSEHLRELLLAHHEHTMSRDAELLLMFAARAEHLDKLIQPALTRGDWVVCDRFTDATYAYQGAGRGIHTARIKTLEQWTQGDLRPDLTLIYDLPVALGLERAGKRSVADRFERETAVFFQRVRAAYLDRATADPMHYQIIDASQSLERVSADTIKALQPLLTA